MMIGSVDAWTLKSFRAIVDDRRNGVVSWKTVTGRRPDGIAIFEMRAVVRSESKAAIRELRKLGARVRVTKLEEVPRG